MNCPKCGNGTIDRKIIDSLKEYMCNGHVRIVNVIRIFCKNCGYKTTITKGNG